MRVKLLAVVVLASIGLSARPCSACSCGISSIDVALAISQSGGGPLEKKGLLGAGDSVFAGRVTKIQKDSKILSLLHIPQDVVKVTIEVSQVWKGEPSPVRVVRTQASSASCGFSFVKGTEYLIF